MRAMIGAAVATSALFLSACGSTPTDEGAAPDEAYTVEHAMGSATLPSVPERVVVIDSPHLDALVALGITPVGATESGAGEGFPSYLAGGLDGTTSVGTTAEPDIEAIAGLAPDLIIGSKVRHEKIYDQLSAIAPTVYSVNSGTDWQEQARVTAAAVDETPEMDALLTSLADRTVQVGQDVGAEGRTVSMVRFRPTNFRLYGPSTFSGSILTQAGFDLGERDWNEYSMLELSPEHYAQIDGDVVFYTNPGGDPSATTMGTVTGIWGTLPAVQGGKVFEFEDETWMVGIGVVGANLILDQIGAALG
ncbi:ABC transporter substrate-binding protein [Rhodococcus sp. RD6.2]|uniref:ABC transporter substrate-binding protein n=1 Tax=Rhodococcus sp. RD6.2 TaxID=260936 RepID=UPI000A07A8D1|nr:iron-siderophore ABC transporter substrate-binding protein [Rhodococcus sp. RD6.2]